MKTGKFSIWSVKTIEEGIEVLTGKKAGQKLENGAYEEGTINQLVDKQLRQMADKLKDYTSVEAQKKSAD